MAITRKQVTRDIGTDVGERGPLLTNGGNVTEAATERISEWISSKKKNVSSCRVINLYHTR